LDKLLCEHVSHRFDRLPLLGLTGYHLRSFVDRDMLMRHFGNSIGHVQYERQHELEPADPGIAVDSDNNDTTMTGEAEDSEGLGLRWDESDDVNMDIDEDNGGVEIDDSDVGDDDDGEDNGIDGDDGDGGDHADDSDGYATF